MIDARTGASVLFTLANTSEAQAGAGEGLMTASLTKTAIDASKETATISANASLAIGGTITTSVAATGTLSVGLYAVRIYAKFNDPSESADDIQMKLATATGRISQIGTGALTQLNSANGAPYGSSTTFTLGTETNTGTDDARGRSWYSAFLLVAVTQAGTLGLYVGDLGGNISEIEVESGGYIQTVKLL